MTPKAQHESEWRTWSILLKNFNVDSLILGSVDYLGFSTN